jgi:membrane protein
VNASSESNSQSVGSPTSRERRGRHARKPSEVPRRGWWEILGRTRQQLKEDNLTIVAAGVAFYGFVAVVPALAATIGIYALFAQPEDLTRHFDLVAQVVPGEVMPILREQLSRIAANERAASISTIVGLLIALYSSAKATKAIMIGLNIAYDEPEKRGFFRLNATALALTLGAIAGWIAAIGLIAVLPSVLRWIGLGDSSSALLELLRWPVLLLLFMSALSVLYRVAPSRNAARWSWLSWGAGCATLLWAGGSVLFSVYVSNYGNYNQTYGSLGAIVVFLLWLFLTAYVVLLGAELNSEMERQTAHDTTKGAPQPIGARQAYAADTLGGSPSDHESKAPTRMAPQPKRSDSGS